MFCWAYTIKYICWNLTVRMNVQIYSWQKISIEWVSEYIRFQNINEYLGEWIYSSIILEYILISQYLLHTDGYLQRSNPLSKMLWFCQQKFIFWFFFFVSLKKILPYLKKMQGLFDCNLSHFKRSRLENRCRILKSVRQMA